MAARTGAMRGGRALAAPVFPLPAEVTQAVRNREFQETRNCAARASGPSAVTTISATATTATVQARIHA